MKSFESVDHGGAKVGRERPEVLDAGGETGERREREDEGGDGGREGKEGL